MKKRIAGESKKHGIPARDVKTGDWLVMYHGGGYSGCFWEWNAFGLRNGRPFDILSTGSSGVYMDGKLNMTLLGDVLAGGSSGEMFRLTNADAMMEFGREYNSTVVHVVMMRLREMTPFSTRWKLVVPCTECGGEIDYGDGDTGTLEDLRGCGGIASAYNKLVCEHCMCEGSCSRCGEHVGRDGIKEGGMCSDCVDATLEERGLTEEAERIREAIDELPQIQKRYAALVPKFSEKSEKQMLEIVEDLKQQLSELVED